MLTTSPVTPAPSLASADVVRVGPWAVASGGPVTAVQRDDGFYVIQCGAAVTLVNVSGVAQAVSVATGIDEGAQTIGTAVATLTVPAGYALQLPNPPAGQPWVIASASDRTLRRVGWLALAAGVGVGLLAGYGAGTLVWHAIQACRRHAAHGHAVAAR